MREEYTPTLTPALSFAEGEGVVAAPSRPRGIGVDLTFADHGYRRAGACPTPASASPNTLDPEHGGGQAPALRRHEVAAYARSGSSTNELRETPGHQLTGTMHEDTPTLTPTLSLCEGEGAVSIPSPPEGERVRVRGEQDAKNTFVNRSR